MAELQATIEISVELNRFFNVDLFQRGYYQVQVALKTPLKPLARVEISDNKENVLRGSTESAAAFRQSSVGKSRKFQVLYRNEEVNIGDIFIFRIHTLVESAKLEKNLESLDLRLDVQLWCNDEDEIMESDATMELASSRTLLLHLSPTKGLHHFLPVLFDYFHLSAIEVVIHGTVIALHQPYLTLPKSQKAGKAPEQSTLEAVYFGQKVAAPGSTPSNVASSSLRLQQAHLMHKTICNILLSAHESLQDYLQQYAALIPGNNFQLACKDCLTRLGETVLKVQGVLEEDDLIQTALTDITQLCAENVLLWAQFLEVALKQSQVHLHLAVEHHSQRVRRFAEGFFSLEHNKSSCLSCYDPCFHEHSALASVVKNSPYFCNLPSLMVECVELDGDENSLPVIFEDIFCDARASQPQVCQKSIQTVINNHNNTGLSKDCSSSNASSSSQSSDRATPPYLRKRLSVKKFIKNKKPEGFKSTSSYHCRDSQAVSVLPPGVTLTGYRKIYEPDSVPSGTNLTSHLERTQSFPVSSSSYTSTCLEDGRQESVPNVGQPGLTASAHSSHLATSVSKPGLSDISNHDLTTHNPALTSSATLTESPCIYLKQTSSSSDSSLTVTSKPPIPHTTKDSFVGSTSTSKLQHSASLRDHRTKSKKLFPHTAQNSSTNNCSKLDKEDLNRLVDDINKALGEKEPTECKILTAEVSSNDDDFSNDDTDIANGYDDELCTYKHNFSSTQSSSSKPALTIDLTSQPSPLQDQGSSLSFADQVNDVHPTSVSSNSTSALGSKVTSKEEINFTSSSSADVSIEQHKATKIMKPEVITTPGTSLIVSNSLTDPNMKVTVMELLKEEYRNSVKGGVDNPAFDASIIQLDNDSSPTQLDNSSSTIQLDNPSEPSPFGSHRAASDSDILKNCEENQRSSQHQTSELLLSKTSIYGNEKRRSLLTSSSSYPELSHSIKLEPPRLVSLAGHRAVNFAQLRENLKLQMDFPGYLYSECPVLASSIPYFYVPVDVDESSTGIHLIVCVHGLDGNSADLRLVRTFIEMALPGFKLDFLMSERNQQDTFADFDKMTDRLVDEILTFLDTFGLQVARISFVGHSLGNIIIRSTLSRPEMSHLLPKLYTLLSLSGPHLGTLYNTSGLVNMGLWFMQKWKKSGSLLQLSLKDHSDPRQTFLYRLSQKPVLQNFKHVLLVASHQDRYVPYHSSRIENCRSAQKDSTVIGAVYREMVQNILEPIIQSAYCTLIRYDVFHALPSTANTMIGRAAHIAVLDSEIFIEKFLAVTGLKYFQ